MGYLYLLLYPIKQIFHPYADIYMKNIFLSQIPWFTEKNVINVTARKSEVSFIQCRELRRDKSDTRTLSLNWWPQVRLVRSYWGLNDVLRFVLVLIDVLAPQPLLTLLFITFHYNEHPDQWQWRAVTQNYGIKMWTKPLLNQQATRKLYCIDVNVLYLTDAKETLTHSEVSFPFPDTK